MPQVRTSNRTLRDVFGMLFRHKKKMFLFSAVVFAATAAGVIFAPRKYASTSSLFFRIGKQSVALDPTASTGPTISVNDTTDSEINSALEVLQSRELADRVVNRLGLEAFASPKTEGKEEPAPQWLAEVKGWTDAARRELRELDAVTPHEAAVNDVQSALTIESPKRSRIISVRAKASSPQLAQKINAAVVDEFLDMHLQLNTTGGSLKFFSDQTALLQKELEDATTCLRDLKNNSSLGTIEDARHVLTNRLQTIETERVLAEASVASAEGKTASLNEALANLTERLPTDETAGFDNMAADSMRQQLYALELREMELTSRYTASHPYVAAVREQLARAREVVENMEPGRIRRTTAINPMFQQLSIDRSQEMALARAGKERIQSLDEARSAVIAEQKKLNEREVEITQMSRKIDLLTASYRTYAEKLEQSRIDTAVNDERISNVNVAQPASFVETPISPNKTIVIALGVFVVIFGSVGLAFICEYVDESIKTPDEVEACLDVPVLYSIPRVRQSRVLLN